MLVVLPTYKRLECLGLSLQSVFENEPVAEAMRLVIANNYPPHRAKVEEIVTSFNLHPNYEKWHVVFHHWPATVPAVDNWYGTIAQYAGEGEVVLLHGDDDLLTPWSLHHRCEALQTTKSDLLLSGVSGSVTFLDGEKLHYQGVTPLRGDGTTVPLTAEIFESYGNVFIGSHTYRYTDTFKRATQLVKEWTDGQDWVDYDTRNLMFPYYLVLAVFELKGKMVGAKWHGCIRGTALSERLNARFNASYGWSTGWLLWLMVERLKAISFRNMNVTAVSQSISRQAAQWYVTLWFDNRVNKKLLRRLRQTCPLEVKFSDLLFAARVMLAQWLGLKALALRRQISGGISVYRQERFLAELKNGTLA
ncbi:MAG: hypothetical protein JSU09_18700 [Bacteroidetes bacterium]|nr:hypothetical protein [Bacteroidota bacterium]